MISVKLNGLDIKAKDVRVDLIREHIEPDGPGSLFPEALPFRGEIEMQNLDPRAIEKLVRPRKCLIEFPYAVDIEPLAPRVNFVLGGLTFKVYRRNFKRNRVYLKEVM